MTALAPVSGPTGLMARRRYLPDVVAQAHVIGTGESVAVALQRITTQEFTVAIDALSDPDADIGAAASVATAAVDRISALLRLVRSSIGGDTCGAELQVLGGISVFLDDLTEGEAEARSLDEIRMRYDAVLRPDALSALRDQLLHRRQLLRLRQLSVVQHDGALQQCLQQLRRSRARFGAWPVDQPMHDQQPLPDSFDAFADGLERTYRKGRRQSAKGDDEVRKWQRHARDLGHQVELLSGSWPEVMAGTVATASDLAEILAEHARIGALLSSVSVGDDGTPPPVILDDATAAVVESLCRHERRALRGIASVLSTRLYAETPAAFVSRLARYWSTRG